MRNAKYFAADQALNKLTQIYGEEALLNKSDKQVVKKQVTPPSKINHQPLIELPKPVADIKLLGNKTAPPDDLVDFRSHIEGIIVNLENNVQNNSLQRNFEIFCTKYERFILASPNMFEVNELTSMIRSSFGRPNFIGSYLYDCLCSRHYVIDIMIIHDIAHEEIFRKMRNTYDDIHINKNDKSELNIQVNFKDKDYRFMVYFRKKEDVDEFINYSTLHEDLLAKKITKSNYKYNLPILRRLIRSWRRKSDLLELLPEYLDWLIVHNMSNSISETVSYNNIVDKGFQLNWL
jgi:hypothetical protein